MKQIIIQRPKGVAALFVLCAWFYGTVLIAQTRSRISIQEAWQKAIANYPLIKQKSLLQHALPYTLSNASKGYLPVLSFTAQATWQSAVTAFPFSLPVAGFKMPVYNRDQYRVLAEVSQLIYDGGMIRLQQQTARANDKVEQLGVDAQLYALYGQVNELFFGALLLSRQLAQNALLQKDIQNGMEKIKALADNGVALKSGVDEMAAQALQARQAAIQLRYTQSAFLNMLGLFLNDTLTEATELAVPPLLPLQQDIRRPELLLYNAQRQLNQLQYRQLHVQLRPRLSLFFQGGYGRPGLNMLSNDFSAYYVTGIRAGWNLGSLYTFKNQQRIISLNSQAIGVQEQSFLFRTRLQLMQQNEEVKKMTALLRTDDEIIVLRQQVKQTASAQLENGVLSAHDYLVQVIAEDEARQNRMLHQLQLLQALYQHRYIAGQTSIP